MPITHSPNEKEYTDLYRQSVTDPEAFWGEQAALLEWIKPPTKIKNTSFHKPVSIKWFEDGVLNVSANCLDRHLAQHGDKTAFIFERDTPGKAQHISYSEAHREVCKLANVLKDQGVKKGDRVTLYMPMVPEAAYAMLACARIGAVHSVVFGGFSPEALCDRIEDCRSDIVLTADVSWRGGKSIPLKKNVDKALSALPEDTVRAVLVLDNGGDENALTDERHVDWRKACAAASEDCAPEPMGAEDPLFILYTSGSTGKPKGVLHTTGGYLLYAMLTTKVTFDLKDEDIYWCTADVGWVTGHSYIVYGPLANAATSLIFEGVPTYPDASRLWQVVDTHKINILYTAPTAIRALLKEGDAYLETTTRQSLRVLGTVGEPINKEAWDWYHDAVGHGNCPIVDTWWQTETGGHLITPLPHLPNDKPGVATKPFFGVQPVLLDADGNEVSGAGEGSLCFKDSWPGQMRSVYQNHDRFEETYFSAFPGYYFSGDGAQRDADGDYRITGRMDDVINVSGHRLGTAEIEDAINRHPKVAESAVVGAPHDVKGQGIYAFVLVKGGENVGDAEQLKAEIRQTVRDIIGPVASPDTIQIAAGLPKTRSGKIMRRILRKIAAGETDTLGDTSTLAEPDIVEKLIQAAA